MELLRPRAAFDVTRVLAPPSYDGGPSLVRRLHWTAVALPPLGSGQGIVARSD